MSSDSPLKHEKEDLEALEEEKADKRELLEEAKEASILEGGLSTRLLDSRISSMVRDVSGFGAGRHATAHPTSHTPHLTAHIPLYRSRS